MVFRRCHLSCDTSADCPAAADGSALRCVVGDKPPHVCQLDDEVKCVYYSDCPSGQVCARDAQCRDECATDRDSISDQVCSSSTCALPSELGEDGLLPHTNGESSPESGDPCLQNSECTAVNSSFVCRAGQCDYECYANLDCANDETCVLETADSLSGGICEFNPAVPCVPNAQQPCDCLGGAAGAQVCATDGQSFGECFDLNGVGCGAPPP